MRRLHGAASVLLLLLLATSAQAQRGGEAGRPGGWTAQPRFPPIENAGSPPPVQFSAPRCAARGFGADAGWLDARHPRLFADVNNDNRDDIVGFKDDGVYVALSNGDEFWPATRWIEDYGADTGWRQDLHERALADVNNDGSADIVGFGNAVAYVSLSTGTSFAPAQLWVADFGYDQGWRKRGLITITDSSDSPDGQFAQNEGRHHIRLLADVTGEGRADIIGFGDDGVYVALSTGNRFTHARLAVADFGYDQGWSVYAARTTSQSLSALSDRVRTVADINGDRRADIVAFEPNGVHISLSNSLRFTPPRRVSDEFGRNWDGRHLRTMADLNGDGLADIVGIHQTGVWAALSHGGGFGPAQRLLSEFDGAHGWRVGAHPRLFADLNNDARADLVGFGNDGVWIALSAGPRFSPPAFSISSFGFNADNWRPEHPRFTPDINGDGRADIAGFHDSCVMISLAS